MSGKNYSYKLNIEKPCDKDWNEMLGVEVSRYCQHCSKSLIDFTKLTDNEIIDVLENSEGSICGRLSSNQMNRTLMPYHFQSSAYVPGLLIGLLMFGTSVYPFADNPDSNIETRYPIEISESEISVYNTENEISLQEEKEDSNHVEGVVVDKNGEGIPFANVFIEGYKIGSSTDFDGNFWFEVPEDLELDSIKIMVTYLGYKTIKTLFYLKNNLPLNNLKFTLKEDEESLMVGEIIVIDKKRKRKAKYNKR